MQQQLSIRPGPFSNSTRNSFNAAIIEFEKVGQAPRNGCRVHCGGDVNQFDDGQVVEYEEQDQEREERDEEDGRYDQQRQE